MKMAKNIVNLATAAVILFRIVLFPSTYKLPSEMLTSNFVAFTPKTAPANGMLVWPDSSPDKPVCWNPEGCRRGQTRKSSCRSIIVTFAGSQPIISPSPSIGHGASLVNSMDVVLL